jgi:hypothetical protein
MRRIVGFRGIPDDVEAAVVARMAQQEILTRGPRQFAFLIGEQALRNPFCSPPDMVEQLDRLTELSRLPHVSLGVVVWARQTVIWPPENFWIYDSEQVRVDTVPGQMRIKAPSDLALYEKAFATLAETALVGDPARELIATARAEFAAES